MLKMMVYFRYVASRPIETSSAASLQSVKKDIGSVSSVQSEDVCKQPVLCLFFKIYGLHYKTYYIVERTEDMTSSCFLGTAICRSKPTGQRRTQPTCPSCWGKYNYCS